MTRKEQINRTKYHKYCDLGRIAERERILKLIDESDDYGMETVRTFKRVLKQKI